MADFDWPADLVPYAMTFYLQPHVGRSESPFTRDMKVYGLSAPRWVAKLSFRGGYDGTDGIEAYGRRLDAFIAKLAGGANRVRLWDFRREGGGSFTNAEIVAGDTQVRLLGGASAPIEVGEYVGGDARPHIVIETETRGTDQIVTLQPPFRARLGEGSATFEKAAAYFRLVDDSAGANPTEVGSTVTYELEFVEDLAGPEGAIKVFLPTLPDGFAYHAVNAEVPLIEDYDGPVFRAIPNSGGAPVEVNFAPDAVYTGNVVYPDVLETLRGAGEEVRLDKWYDQSGNGREMTQTVAAKRPGVREDVYINGAPVIFLDGGVNFIGGPKRGFDFTWALSGGDCTIFFVPDFKASIQLQLLFACGGSSGGGSGGRTIYHNYTENGCILEFSPAGTSEWLGNQFRAGPAVYAFREDGGPLDMFVDGVPHQATTTDGSTPGWHPTVETLTGGVLGYTESAPLLAYNTNMRMLAVVAVEGALSDADILAVTRALQTNFAVPTEFDSRIVIVGDSIAEGGANKNTLELMWYLHQESVVGTPETYNLGIGGKTLTACYSDRVEFDATLYLADAPVVYVLQGGSNDINSGVTATTLYATLTSYIAYLHGLGPNVKVVVGTILKRQDFSAGEETQRAAYNALVAANAAGADAIWDPHAALAAVDPNYVNNNDILGDETGTLIHPSSYGYRLLAPSLKTSINSVL